MEPNKSPWLHPSVGKDMVVCNLGNNYRFVPDELLVWYFYGIEAESSEFCSLNDVHWKQVFSSEIRILVDMCIMVLWLCSRTYNTKSVWQHRFSRESWRRYRDKNRAITHGPLNRILFGRSTFSAFFRRILQQQQQHPGSPSRSFDLGRKGFKGEVEWDWSGPWDIRLEEKETRSRN